METGKRIFNTAGTCVPRKHYMVDISGKLKQIIPMIDAGNYFTINRARQYGKTTTFAELTTALKDRYLIIRLSFEGMGEDSFANDNAFVCAFLNKVAQRLEMQGVENEIVEEWRKIERNPIVKKRAFDCLSTGITKLCETVERPVLIMIDEVDKSSDNQIFLDFLGMLRNKYLDAQEEMDTTFHSVILAGVYDIKNLTLKLRPDTEKKYNSPWNIAVDFKVDMSFSPAEIATMLSAYEEDEHTGMDIQKVSGRIYFHISGYPFLVSWLCKWMSEEGNGVFTQENVDRAVKELLKLILPCLMIWLKMWRMIRNYLNCWKIYYWAERKMFLTVLFQLSLWGNVLVFLRKKMEN